MVQLDALVEEIFRSFAIEPVGTFVAGLEQGVEVRDPAW